MMLCMFVGAWAQSVQDGGLYYLGCKATDHGKWIIDNAGTLNGRSATASLFEFETAGAVNEFYIKSRKTGKYLYATGLTNQAKVDLTDEANKTVWVVNAPAHSAGYISLCAKGSDDLYLNNNVTNNVTCLKLNYHKGGPGSGNACSLWKALSTPELTTDEKNPIWYTIKNVRCGKFATYVGDDKAMTLTLNKLAPTFFYFTGEITDKDQLKIKIHNYSAKASAAQEGTEKLCASYNSWTKDGIDWYLLPQNTGISISNTETPSGDGTSWNNYQGKGEQINYWNAADIGSAWEFEKFEVKETAAALQAQALELRNKYDFYDDCYDEIPVPGKFSMEAYLLVGQVAGGIDDIIAAYNALELFRLSLGMPKVGQFLRIKAVAGWNDDAPYLGAKNSTAKTTRAEFVADADKNTIFYYDGSNLVSFGSGNYLVMDNSNMLGYNGVQTEGSKIAFRLASKGTIGAYNITFNNGNRTLYVNQGNFTDGAGTSINDADGYCFNLEEVTEIPVTISAAKYASFYTPVAMTVPTGVTAYYINSKKEVNGETWANLEEIGNVIPAGTGVILYADVEEATTFNLTVGGEATAIEGNWLTGTAASAYIAEDSYVLSNNYGIGLYLAAKNQEGNTKWLNNGFKAYLPMANAVTTSGVLRFNFGGTTAIESVLNNSADANAPIYDLSGRRVMNTVKGGIYIQNGKKYIVK